MRYSVEHQRNIAFDILDFNRKKISIDSAFEENEPVIIYGFDFLSKEIYENIKKKVNVLFFLDRAHDNESFAGTKIYALTNDKIYHITAKYKKIKVIIMILSDVDKISADLNDKFDNVEPLSLYKVIMKCKLLYDKELTTQLNEQTNSILTNILRDNPINIKNIVLVGTSYTELLGILYLKDWKDSLFIMERYVPESVFHKMREQGLSCLYEKKAVQYYAICYLIAEYAKKWGIPIWGHDHMQLSRAFLNNKINVLEDGLGNYDFKYTAQYTSILDNGRKYDVLGYDRLVERVVLTGQFDIPEELIHKVEVVEPVAMWRKKEEKEKKLISYIFGFPYRELLTKSQEGKNIIFLTESSIDVGEEVMTRENQIKLYKNILANYPIEQVMIKPHPADVNNYSELLPGYVVLDKKFPVQMVEWFDINVAKMVMMKESSCVNIFRDRYAVDIYDNEAVLVKSFS